MKYNPGIRFSPLDLNVDHKIENLISVILEYCDTRFYPLDPSFTKPQTFSRIIAARGCVKLSALIRACSPW